MPFSIRGSATEMAGTATALPAPATLQFRRPFASWARRRGLILFAICVLFVVIVCAIAAPWLAPYPPQRMAIARRLMAPSALHWLGTDEFGRDVLSRCMWGARTSLTIGLCVVLLAGSIGTLLGVLAGYVRKLDGALMRLADALMAFPDILLAIALMAALGASSSNVVLALTIIYTPRFARVARAGTLVLRELQFVEAAEAVGASTGRVILVHLVPNLLSALLVQATFLFAAAILTEAGLSFLGAGVPPASPTWGNMIAAAQQYSDAAIWLVLAPGLCIVLTVLALQILGDAFRDALDPKLQRLN